MILTIFMLNSYPHRNMLETIRITFDKQSIFVHDHPLNTIYRLSYAPSRSMGELIDIETSANTITLQNLTSNTQYILYLTTIKVY